MNNDQHTIKNKKRIFPRNVKKYIFLAVMLIIPIVHFAIFWGAVNFNSILLGFQRLNINTQKLYFTFENFKFLKAYFGKSGELRVALGNTLLTWAFLTVFLIPWAFIITYFLYKKIPLGGVWRTMLFIPSLLPAVAMTSIFFYIIQPGAPVGKLATLLTGQQFAFLNDIKYAKWAIILYIFWTNFGGSFILISGAMARVPKEVLESARLDGAGLWTEMLRIILPLCWPTISMLLLLNMAGIFTSSGPILLLTKGQNNTATLSYWIFQEVRFSQYYVPSAMGLVCTAVLFPIVLLVRWGLGKVYADVEF